MIDIILTVIFVYLSMGFIVGSFNYLNALRLGEIVEDVWLEFFIAYLFLWPLNVVFNFLKFKERLRNKIK